MTREDAKAILENLAVISHYAAGGDIEYPFFTWDGQFIKWGEARTLSLCCLGRYRIVGVPMKARVKVNSLQYSGAPAVVPSSKDDLKARRKFEKSRGIYA